MYFVLIILFAVILLSCIDISSIGIIENFTINKLKTINNSTNEVNVVTQKNRLSINRIDTDSVRVMKDRIGKYEEKIHNLQSDLIDKTSYDHLNDKTNINGWFVIVYDLGKTPMTSKHLGVELEKVHGVNRLCFRSHTGDVPFPFLNNPDQAYFLPKHEEIGLRALTVFTVPSNGKYRFKVTSDDGSMLSVMKTTPTILKNGNATGMWNRIINNWSFQAETEKISDEMELVKGELLLMRVDYFQHKNQSTLCIRYSIDGSEYVDIDKDLTLCSLNWNDIPLLNVR